MKTHENAHAQEISNPISNIQKSFLFKVLSVICEETVIGLIFPIAQNVSSYILEKSNQIKDMIKVSCFIIWVATIGWEIPRDCRSESWRSEGVQSV